MKCKIPEISWHNRDPVLSVDIQSKKIDDNSYRLATGGTDSHVLIWYLNFDTDCNDLELVLAADLTRHQRAVNVVKWSPDSEMLASGDDESVIFIWKKKCINDAPNLLEPTNESDKEIWIVYKILRGHREDVYDLCWSPSSEFLVSGSVDNTAMLWDVHRGKFTTILSEHKGFVQGVAWDPKDQYIATLSTDRIMRIFDTKTKRVLHRVDKSTLPVPDGHPYHNIRMRLFHDDTLQTFFRRLTFTPDGKLLLTPSGVTDSDGATKMQHTTYAFSRYALKQPSLILPSLDQYTIAVRCCPKLFTLRPTNINKNPPIVPLPYRMIFAVATRCSVYFYDTQQAQPFAVISNIHYTRLTDLTWSSDGLVVVVSSTDGYCSLINFDKGELGEEYDKSDEVLATAPISQQNNKKSKKKNKKNQKNKESSTNTAVAKSADHEKSALEQSIKMQLDDNNELMKEEGEKPIPIASLILNAKPLPADIILDKEILSSQEKFESPEKKSRPVTPISVRRHPRTPSSTLPSTPSNQTPQALKAPVSIVDKIEITPTATISPRQNKGAKPIAIRRKPRALIPEPTKTNPITLSEEEAMDAWPLGEEKAIVSKKIDPPTKIEKTKETISVVNEATFGCTEDIRLVYEDTNEATLQDNEVKEIKESTNLNKTPIPATQKDINKTPKSENKTPRRVQFKTISTPKSVKKLLD